VRTYHSDTFDDFGISDWTFHVEDGVGRPSFRLLPALRLLHIPLRPAPNHDLRLWEDSLLGLAEIVSAENEAKVRDSITTLCEQVICRSDLKIPLVQSQILIAQDGVEKDGDEGRLLVLCMVKALWEEERQVAELVQRAVVDGVEF
jgi:hypothetical protein